jgi:two-component system sensor histidine kinase UhpB
MHNIIRQLRPGSLDNLGLSETLKDAVNNLQKQQPDIHINLELSGKLEALGESLNINIYRIVQEAMNNAIKHADAKNIEISLSANETGALQLTIKDDGKGMNIHDVDQSNHFGLLGMRERVQSFGGSFNVDSALSNMSGADKTGTTIYIYIPQAIAPEQVA